jgi:hypothetical protein
MAGHAKRGVTVQIQRESDKYRQSLTVMGTQDIEVIMTRACKFRDELIERTGEQWITIRPSEEIKGEKLTPENKAAIDKEIMTGPDCPAKTFLLARYERLMKKELETVDYVPAISGAVDEFATKYKL